MFWFCCGPNSTVGTSMTSTCDNCACRSSVQADTTRIVANETATRRDARERKLIDIPRKLGFGKKAGFIQPITFTYLRTHSCVHTPQQVPEFDSAVNYLVLPAAPPPPYCRLILCPIRHLGWVDCREKLERGHSAALQLFLLCTVLCGPAAALQPAARFRVTIVSDLLDALISNPVDSIVGNCRRERERRDRLHAAEAKSECVSSCLGFSRHGLSPEGIDPLQIDGPRDPFRHADNGLKEGGSWDAADTPRPRDVLSCLARPYAARRRPGAK